MTVARVGTAKSERVNLRLDPAAKDRIERAAAVAGSSVSGFIVASALRSAELLLAGQETLVLSRRDAERLFDAMVEPPAPNERLLRALERHREVVASR